MENVMNRKDLNLIVMLLLLQIISIITIIADIPIIRQVFGFVYFSIVPGFMITKLLRLDMLDRTERFLLSIGTSIVFLMLVGLLINEFSPLLGVSSPLTLMPIVIFVNSCILLLEILVYQKNARSHNKLKLPLLKELLPLSLVIIPVLSVIGAFFVNLYGNNIFLLVMLLSIAAIFILCIFLKKLQKFFPIIVLFIAVGLLFHTSLISNYIVAFGSDVPVEHYVYRTVESNLKWNVEGPFPSDYQYGRLNSMLSITVLPMTLTTLLDIESTWIFKIINPLIFSIVPVILYKVWQERFGAKTAFVAAFIFMAQATFYTEMLGLSRQMIAELFFALLLFVILCKKIAPAQRLVLFTLFSFGLITSHYGLAEIFLFFIGFTSVWLFISNRHNRKITISMVFVFFTIMFFWYIFTSNSSVFESFISFGDNVISQLGDFFDPASRGQTVLRGLGVDSVPTIWNLISRGFAYLTEFLILLGFISLSLKKANVQISKTQLIFIRLAMVLLALLILVPGLADTMNMTRFYHTLLFFLAPLCVVGAILIIKVFKQRTILVSFVLVVILVPYFLFQTGFVYEIVGTDSWSLPLSGYRMNISRLYGQVGEIDTYSVVSAEWLANNTDRDSAFYFSDSPSRYNVLTCYGMIYRGSIIELSNFTELPSYSYIFLSTYNVEAKILPSAGRIWNLSDLYLDFNSFNKIYSNGHSENYISLPN